MQHLFCDDTLAVNVHAPLLLCKCALPSMLAQRSGVIFCITSGAARGYRPGRVGYSMSKAALERMFLSLAEEVRHYNIAVNVLRGCFENHPALCAKRRTMSRISASCSNVSLVCTFRS